MPATDEWFDTDEEELVPFPLPDKEADMVILFKGILSVTETDIKRSIKDDPIQLPIQKPRTKNFTDRLKLSRDVSTCYSDEKFHCPECGKVKTSKKILQHHIRQIHKREKTEPCNQCELKFYDMEALRNHMNKIHDKIKPWHCEEC